MHPFPTIGPAEQRRYLAAARARQPGRKARLAAVISALSARGLHVGTAAQLPAALCSDRSSPVAGMTSTGAAPLSPRPTDAPVAAQAVAPAMSAGRGETLSR